MQETNSRHNMISVILPVYNVEKFLKESVDSVLNQTYRDLQVILVDDGSTDSSGAICDDYATRDDRIQVIHKTNGGLPDARNAGLKIVKGDYIMFVDSDDLIHPETCQVLLDALSSGDYDFSMIYGIKLPEETYHQYIAEHNGPVEVKKTKVINQYEYIKHLYEVSAYQYDVVWNKLYKRSFIDNLYFRIVSGEDLEWSNRMSQRMNQAIIVKLRMYYYIQHNASIMHQGASAAYVNRINTFMQCLDDIPKEKRQYRDWCLRAMYSMTLYIRYLARGTELQKDAVNKARVLYKKTRSELLRSNLSWSKKFRILCNYHFPAVYNAVMDRMIKRKQGA